MIAGMDLPENSTSTSDTNSKFDIANNHRP
jgi:hypothetical protein